MTQIQGLVAGDQLATQDGLERPLVDVGAEARGDVLGCGIGLLSGQAALLDWEVGAVAGGVDVLDAFNAGVLVDRSEAVRVGG